MAYLLKEKIDKLGEHKSEFYRAEQRVEAARLHMGKMVELNPGLAIDHTVDLEEIEDAKDTMRYRREDFEALKAQIIREIKGMTLPDVD